MKRIMYLLSLLYGSYVYGGDFANLSFENVNTNSLTIIPGWDFTSGAGAIEDLMPGWQLSYNGSTVAQIGYNNYPIGGGADGFSIVSRAALKDGTPFLRPIGPVIEEDNAVLVQGFVGNFSLSQSGTIPNGVQYLTLRYNETSLTGRLDVRIDGGSLGGPIGSNYTVSYDVSEFAGRNVELELNFSAFTSPEFAIDDIQFVPEPTTFSLGPLGAGTLFFLCFYRKRRRKSRAALQGG